MDHLTEGQLDAGREVAHLRNKVMERLKHLNIIWDGTAWSSTDAGGVLGEAFEQRGASDTRRARAGVSIGTSMTRIDPP